MKEAWTGDLVGRMHTYEVTQDDLAKEIGVSKAYISMILNGQKNPPNAKERLNDAFEEIAKRRKLYKPYRT